MKFRVKTSGTGRILAAAISGLWLASVMSPWISVAQAEEAAKSPDSPAVTQPSEPEKEVSQKSTAREVGKKAKGGNRTREKDADGTEAPDRFKGDTVIKSQYKLNGQPLEVDTD